MEKVVKEICSGVDRVNFADFKGFRCLEIVWTDGSTSLIPVSLFEGKKDKRKALRRELRELVRLRKYLEEAGHGCCSEEKQARGEGLLERE